MPSSTYHSYCFPNHWGADFQEDNELSVTWAEILWAAMTVGKSEERLNQYGSFSWMERIHRAAVIGAAIKEDADGKLQRSGVYAASDPTEKGYISYFLGMVTSKLMARKYLNVPWLVHIDVLRDRERIQTPGRSRPDLAGTDDAGNWCIVEAKGRSNGIGDGTPPDVLESAKEQTREVKHINHEEDLLRIACAAHFYDNADDAALEISWCDPKGKEGKGKPVEFEPVDYFLHYYRPLVAFLKRGRETGERNVDGFSFQTSYVPEAGIKFGLSDLILQWFDEAAEKRSSDSRESYFASPRDFPSLRAERRETDDMQFLGEDGVLIETGDRWRSDVMRKQPWKRD